MATRRNHEIKLRLNDEEFDKLKAWVVESGISREKYIRLKLFGAPKKAKKKSTKKINKEGKE